MSDKPEWRYFLRDYELEEVYRFPNNGKDLFGQNIEDVELLFEDGSWHGNYQVRLTDVMMQGWFAESKDEITEAEAMAYFEKWKASKWPGGKCTWTNKS